MSGFLGGFLKVAVPLNHPFIDGCAIIYQPFWDPPRLWQPHFKVAPNTPNTRGGTWLIKWLNDQFPSLVAIIYIQWIGAIMHLQGKKRRPTFRISSVRGILPRVASAMLRTRGKWEHHMENLIQKSPRPLTPLLARLYNFFLSLKSLCLYP